TYDAYGNLKARFEHGDPSIGGDERRTYWDYYPNINTSMWIVNRPAQESVYTGLTGPLASQTRNIYDNLPGYTSAPTRGALTRVDRWDGSTWLLATRTAYDAWGNPTVITNALGLTTTMTYDGSYHLYPIAVSNMLNQTTRTDYDLALGVPLAVTDPNSAVTNYRYDTFGRLLKIIKPGDSETIPTIEYQYSDAYSANNLHGLRVTQKLREVSGEANAYRSIYTFYDGTGRLVQTRAEAGDGSQQAVTNVVYDARGLTQFSYAPAFEPTSADYSSSAVWGAHPHAQTQYDALGRTIVVTSTDSSTATRTAFSGRSIGVLDTNGHQHISTTDALGRLAAVKEYTSTATAINFNATAYATTTYAYDTLNNLVRVTDTLSNSTIIAYNRLGQKTVITDTDMGVWQYAYDLVGNLTRQTDARGQRVCFYYDPLNRLTGKQYRADDACPTLNPTLNVTYTYDSGVNGVGRRTGMIDDSGAANWIYDVRGRTIVDSRTIPGVRAFGLGYTYDAMDRLTAITYPNGEVVTQTYNAGAQVVGLTGANPYVSGLTYNAQGQIKQMSWGNGATTTYDYYGDGGPVINSFRLWRINTVKSGNPLLDLQYGYDKVGNINRITDTVNSAQVVTFTYDALDRLTNAATTAVGNGQYSEGYTYNAIGNILSKGSATYQYTDTLHKHAVTTAGSNSYSYDANGNMLTRNEASVLYHQSWDAENRLQVVTNTVTGEVTRFVYDGDGARVQQIYSGTYTSTTIYLGAPTEINILGAPLSPPTSTIPPTMTYRAYLPLVMGGQPIPPRTQPFANETWKMYYAVGNQVAAMRVLTSTGSTLYYLRSDHLGSTSVTMDASGTKIGEMRYKPYGEIRYTDGISPTDISYTGQRLDSTGLMFYQARYYSPNIGRFVSADTIVPDENDPQALNRYTYGYNSPLRFVDPSGHDPLDEEWINAFRAAHHREPSTYDRLIRLFSIAFPDEWNDNGWQKFYNPDGSLRPDDVIHDVLVNGPANRDWSKMPDALAALAGYYKPDESEKYVRDIGSLFGGLPDRFDEPSIAKATTERPLPRHHWAYLSRSGIPAWFSNDADGNVHHWAWALVLGYHQKQWAFVLNTGREANQAAGENGYDLTKAYSDAGGRADIWLGNRGVLLGCDIRFLGVSPNRVRLAYWVNMPAGW
ncbi:partial tRNA(Glu)-specific nuclease WapA, partial [Anaerolineales bacterium]